MTEARWERTVPTRSARLQSWLQGSPTPENHWIPQYRGRSLVTLGNLVADLRYWASRMRAGGPVFFSEGTGDTSECEAATDHPLRLTLGKEGVVLFEGQWNDEMHKAILLFAQDCIAYGQMRSLEALMELAREARDAH